MHLLVVPSQEWVHLSHFCKYSVKYLLWNIDSQFVFGYSVATICCWWFTMANFVNINSLTDNYVQTRSFSDADIENILFPPTALHESLIATTTTVDLNRKLKPLLLKKSRYVLHGITLTEYMHAKRIPRGLCIQKPPTLGSQDPMLCQQMVPDPWQSIFGPHSPDHRIHTETTDPAQHQDW